MKFNHICLIVGIFLLILGVSVFAHASVAQLDCSNGFNCEIKSYCQSNPNAVLGLLVSGGQCGSTGSLPCVYSFNSTTTGLHSCTVTITTTAMHSQNQVNENTTVLINGTTIGTTVDNYCNGSESEGCTFCGRDVQTLPSKTLSLNSTNTITLQGHDSHAVVSVTANCTPTDYNCVNGVCTFVRNCNNDLSPTISTIPNQSVKYNGTLKLDLWNYINDYDDSLSDLTISAGQIGNSVSCVIDNNRYLECDGTENIGTSTIDVEVMDSCGKSQVKTFDIVVTNNTPSLSISNLTKSCVNDFNKFLDLRDYAYDENVLDLNFAIISESNSGLIDCNVDSNNKNFLTCSVNTCSDSCSTVTLRTIDILGAYSDKSFNLCLNNSTPTWKSVPSICINDSNSRLIDLKQYASDIEDKNNLTFSLTQSNSSAVSCSIESSSYISCTDLSNKSLSNTLTLKATDSKGKYATIETTISTNCFDENGNDTNQSGQITFEAQNKAVCMENCVTYGTQLKLTNNSTEKKCFSFDAESYPYNMLNVSLAESEVCINSGETRFVTLNANSCGADSRSYQVKVSAKRIVEGTNWNFSQTTQLVDTNLSLLFDFQVGTCQNFGEFRINEFDGKICKGETKNLNVFVRNTTSSSKTVLLNADNAMILPYFEKSYVDLSSGQEKVVQLVVNTNNLSLGYYTILLEGDATDYHISKKLEIEVVNCDSIAKRTFSINVPQVCFDVRRGQTFQSQFSITRQSCTTYSDCYNREKEFFLSIGGMPNELAYNSVLLTSNQSKSIEYSILVPTNAPAGNQLLTISGTDSLEYGAFVEEKLLCLNVLGEAKTVLTVRTQAKDILWCGSEVFELELTNTGDFDANFVLSTTSIPVGVSVNLSETNVTVKKGTTKVIYAAVSTNPNSQIKDNQFFVVSVSGSASMSAKVYFNIKQKTALENIEILSATNQIDIRANSTAAYDITIRNNTESTLKGIVLSFEGIPADVNIESKIIGDLLPGQVISVSGVISAGDANGFFEPSFVVSSGSMLNKKQFGLYIQGTRTNAGLAGLFTGMFAFDFGNGNFFLTQEVFGAFLLVIVLIALLTVIILGIAIINKPKTKEVWAN
ncbi:MAG: hypothetical protein WC821_04540 [archaeon]|jgi:hypothetical protein